MNHLETNHSDGTPLNPQQSAIITENICPLCYTELDYIGQGLSWWKCTNPDCGQEFVLTDAEGNVAPLGEGGRE